jgi:hypothetical protein
VSRNLEFFTIHSDRGHGSRDTVGRRCVSALTAKEVAQRPFRSASLGQFVDQEDGTRK